MEITAKYQAKLTSAQTVGYDLITYYQGYYDLYRDELKIIQSIDRTKVPNFDKLSELFRTEELADPTALMQSDGSRVRVLNGSFSPGLDVSTGNYLISLGVPVTEVGTADRPYDRTEVILYAPKLYTLKFLQTVFGVNSNAQIQIKPDPASTVDVEVRLGNDWANANTMP